jgi:hypothetical protein
VDRDAERNAEGYGNDRERSAAGILAQRPHDERVEEQEIHISHGITRKLHNIQIERFSLSCFLCVSVADCS